MASSGDRPPPRASRPALGGGRHGLPRADDPLAYGIDKLRQARATVARELNKLDAAVPPDRSGDLESLRRQLLGAVTTRQQAEEELVESGRQLGQARRRSWGRRHRSAISGAAERANTGEDRLEQAITAEAALRADLDIPRLQKSSGFGKFLVSSVSPGDVLVVVGVVLKAAVEDPDESVAEGS